MGGSILLHRTKGVNPYLTYCPRCGGDGPDLILVGTREFVAQCTGCELTVFGGGKCPKCNRTTTFVRKLEERERLPGSLCAACLAEVMLHKEIVAAGGVYWKCVDCRAEGVIKAEAPFAAQVRAAHGIEAPAPCGMEFTKADCPKCSVEATSDGQRPRM